MRPWDDGVRWHTNQTVAPTDPAVSTDFVRDDFLKLRNGAAEDYYLEHLVKQATRMAERTMRRAVMEQTRELVMDRFPGQRIELPWPPLIAVDSIVYIDESGDEQAWDPANYQVSLKRGPTCGRSVVAPARGQTFPSTDPETLEAVIVTYRCGYVDGGSPSRPNVPEDILHGILLVVGEAYKQRSESVIGTGVAITPAVLRAKDLWTRGYKVF